MALKALSRRNVMLGAGGLVGLAALIATPGLRPLLPGGVRRMLDGGRAAPGALALAQAEGEQWAAQVGSTFSVAGQTLRLAGIRPLESSGERPAGLRRRAFLAVFDIAGGGSLPADLIYELTHRRHGALSLFLSATDNPSRMHAVFN